ncbi:hypothetical protein AB0L53_49750, partial [Nonomuraea sp. NPDC052129]|uniref:hypothetical protein n=1 Tax=Nonomuraea sp. NPDC052129 TaxID=3154651 RepID=UPI00341FF61C
MCFLTISGLDRAADPARATRLRGRIHAALRTAAERRGTTYQATESTITIGTRPWATWHVSPVFRSRPQITALACQLPAETGTPLSRWSSSELAREAVAR